MIKFVYIVSLSIMSFLLFIFSKDKVELVCNSKAIGEIEVIKDSTESYLCIKAEDNKRYFPSSMAEGVVLAAGQKVVICYSIDSSALNTERSAIPIHIGSISYLNQ